MTISTRSKSLAIAVVAMASVMALGQDRNRHQAPSHPAPRRTITRQAPVRQAPVRQAPIRQAPARQYQSRPSTPAPRSYQPTPRRTYQPTPGRTYQPTPGRTYQPSTGRYTAPSTGRYTAPATGRYTAGRGYAPNGTRPQQFTRQSARSTDPHQFNFTGRTQSETAYRSAYSQYGAPHVMGHIGYQSPEWGGHWRYGYSGWHGYGTSLGFHFGLYLYTPFAGAVYPSPWYYYPGLPPYVPASAVVVVPGYSANWTYGNPYSYQGGQNEMLNSAIGEISSAFSSQNAGAVAALVPSGGQVAVFADGQYEYSLNGPDFQNMLSDDVSAVDTTSFQITSVRAGGNWAVVHAAHTFQNTDGSTETVNQTYRLRLEGGQYVMTDFMTNHTG